MGLRQFLTGSLLATLSIAAPIMPPPDVTDGSVIVTAEDHVGVGATQQFVFDVVLTSGGVSERYSLHHQDAIRSIAVAKGRVAIFAEATADAMGPILLEFGEGGCPLWTCYQGLLSYRQIPWMAHEISYPEGYVHRPVAGGGGVRFTGFTGAGLLTGLIVADRIDMSLQGPDQITLRMTWDVVNGEIEMENLSAGTASINNPEPATIGLTAGGLAVIWAARRKRRR